MTTAEKTDTLTLIARCHNQRLTIVPAKPLRNWQGERYGEAPGVAIQFHDHRAVIEDRDGHPWINGEPVATVPGQSGSPQPVLSTSDLVARLFGDEERGIRPHELLNRHDGFYVEGDAPGELKPTVDEQIQAITRAAVALDAEAIGNILLDERETHNREVVITSAEAALTQIAETEAQS
jgi:hypothetical protein